MEFCFSRHHPHLMIFLNFLKITVELLFNKEPSDLQNLFAKISYCSIVLRIFFIMFCYCWVKKNIICYLEVCLIEVPLYDIEINVCS